MDQASSLRKIVNNQALQRKREASTRKSSSDNTNSAPRVIVVTSGKGGVGKTNIVANLAMAFRKLGKKVLILDADIGLANIDIIFGLYPRYNIGHVINGEKKLSEIIVKGPEGIRIVPAGSGLTNLTQLTEGQKLKLLSEFETLGDDLDILLIDTAAGISSDVIYFNLAADERIIVATTEPTSISDAYAMMKVMSTQHGTKHFKLIVNMAKDSGEAQETYLKLSQVADHFLTGVVTEYIGYVPVDDMIKKAVINRKAIMELFPDAASSKKLNEIAKTLLDAPRQFDSDGTIKFFLQGYMDYRKRS